MNLHAIASRAINVVNPNRTVTLYRSVTQSEDDYEVDASGAPVCLYIGVRGVKAQVQSEGDAALYYSDHVSQNSIVRKAYLHAPKTMRDRPYGQFRPLGLSGDFVKMTDGDVVTWWLIDAVTEDFGHVGWVCVRMILQVEPPPIDEEHVTYE